MAANKGFLLRILDAVSYTLPASLAAFFQKKPDVIVATSPSLFAAIAGLLVSKLRRRPFILEVSDLWPASIVGVGAMRDNLLIKWLEKLELFLYRQAERIIVLSPVFKTNLISRNIDSYKIHIVINGVDIERYAPRVRNHALAENHQIKPDDFVIGYIGTHGMAHGLENVLQAAELLQNKSNIRFLFVGAGAAREDLIKIANEKKLMNISFVPSQPKEIISDFWALCNMALVHLKNATVFSEVIPSKIFEAMGMGLPILISAPQGVAVSLVENEQIGASVPPDDPISLAKTIDYYQENRLLLQAMADNSHKKAPEYSRQRQAEDFIGVLQKASEFYAKNS